MTNEVKDNKNDISILEPSVDDLKLIFQKIEILQKEIEELKKMLKQQSSDADHLYKMLKVRMIL